MAEDIIQATQKYIHGNYKKQHSECEVRWLNPKLASGMLHQMLDGRTL